MQLTRRTLFVAAPVALLPGWGPAETRPRRDMLSQAWAERLPSSLPTRSGFHPFPTAAERAAWGAIPDDARMALLQTAESQLKTQWDVLPATQALEFQRTGNRSHYESTRNRRRTKLQDLVVAESIEGKGRFIDEIVNGIWLTCEETFWGLPAHLGAQKAGVGLPDVTEPIVDLFAAETSSLLAWTYYEIGDSLARVSPLVPQRISLEIDRRILTPCLERNDFSWMGFSGKPVNNWNPWICSNWLTSVLLIDNSDSRRQKAVLKILSCLDNFLNGYADDGGCDEGPSYWGRAGGSLFDCLDLLHRATNGAINGFSFPLVHQIGLYICRAHIYNEWYTNFADAPARVYTNGDLVYRFGERLNDSLMMQHGAFAAFLRDPAGIPGDSIGRQLPALFNLSTLRQAPRSQALLRDVWLSGIQVMAARCHSGSADGIYLAAQGGNNGESHNHNDVGNFLIYSDGQPAIIDVGVETYTAKTFSPHRYEIWTMQSAYHNCPTINGIMQSAGRQFAARDVRYHADDNTAEFYLDVAAAYPAEAQVEHWNRTLRLDRTKSEVELLDEYALRQTNGATTLTLMTPCVVSVVAPGELSLNMPSGKPVRVSFDAHALVPKVEEIKLEDARLRQSWGDRLFRITLRAEAPPSKASWVTRFTRS
ncbi:MAG: heparinase II/III family protein [Bryobacteraceae bacterium]